MDYDVLLVSLAIDLVAISVLTYAIYFHRHRRRDLTLGFLGVNIGLFAVASFVSTRPVGLAFGIGLFALLSVIRLRSTQITQEEIGYYFVAVVIGLVNGLSPDEHWGVTITLTVVLVGVMYVADHPWMLRRYQRRIVILDSAKYDEAKLRRVLERKLDGEVVKLVVLDVDFVHKRTKVDVRYRPRPPGEPGEAEPAEHEPVIAAAGPVVPDEPVVAPVPAGFPEQVPVDDASPVPTPGELPLTEPLPEVPTAPDGAGDGAGDEPTTPGVAE